MFGQRSTNSPRGSDRGIVAPSFRRDLRSNNATVPFKLDWMLFPQFPGGETSFLGSYARTHPDTERRNQRRHLTYLLESLNAVANAAGEPANPDYETGARARLQWNLDRT